MKRYAFILVALLAACGGGSSTPAAPVLAASASPSPTPTASAGATPSSAIAASPSSLSFASGTTQNITVSESAYSGTFTESDTCNPFSGTIASIVAATKGAGSATYAVTPVAAGTCAVTFTDSAGRTTGVNVTVSTAAITVQ